MTQQHSLIILHSIGFTHRDLKKIFETHENSDHILNDVRSGKWGDFPWILEDRKEKIKTRLRELDEDLLIRTITSKNISIITLKDESYPKKLRAIKQAPYLLYIRGTLRETPLTFGVVGSRKSTSYGTKVIEHILGDLIREGAGIVSGGAYGIDSISHSETLKYDGYTIAVFGCGVDVSYPPKNHSLFEEIIEKGGCLLSIFPIGTKPEPFYFPIRNEIVAGLSDGIIIPEAGEKSGTLITANLALEHGRDVFAVPGDIFRETSQGTNMLISTGQAKGIQSSREILEEYQLIEKSPISHETRAFTSEKEKQIFESIENGYTTPDRIQSHLGEDISTVIMNLSLLEMQGYIELSSHGTYTIC